MGTWQERLNAAVEEAGLRPAHFQARLAETGVKGSSYGAVWSYLKKPDATDPPLEFFQPAAQILGVRAEWLAWGIEPRTDEELEQRYAAAVMMGEAESSFGEIRRAVLSAVWEAAPQLRPLGVGGVDHIVLSVVPEVVLWIGPGGAALEGFADERERYLEAARMLGQALAAPLEALRLDPASWSQELRAMYVLHALAGFVPLVDHAFGEAVRRRRFPDPEEEADNA